MLLIGPCLVSRYSAALDQSSTKVSLTADNKKLRVTPIWFLRFWPTGKSSTTGISKESRVSLGPTPERSRMCGEFSAPALKITCKKFS